MKNLIKMAVLTSLVMTSTLFAATYKIDAAHSDVGFSISHLGISKVKGEFKDLNGQINWNGKDDVQNASFKGEIAVDSIDTQNKKRDDHLVSADFFNANKNPNITFESKEVKKRFGKLSVIGNLTINGVTKEVKIPVTINGPVTDPWGNEKIGIQGKLTIDRKDYGLTWNKTLDKGGVLIGEEVDIVLNIQGAKTNK